MAYESVNPFTEQLLKSIPEHSEAKHRANPGSGLSGHLTRVLV
ncbi:hypothetical protein ACPOL_2831 [Acidisarcina polymorpha]|uniref:Uncharacterized protein n=1 Tax=Acidisarcina polymorpha TaxID=2211140 RepID=A0A2Z5FZ53_9BACT|nr:hypothetical protein ACPOL_2831 [Acidisarcina polymorpha]